MAIQFNDLEVKNWIQDGVQQAIRSALRDQYSMGRDLKAAMDKAIKEAEPQILAGLKIAISQACVSPEFLKSLEKEIAASMASQYRGAFDGVIRAAAKQAAHDDVVARRVVELTRQAAGAAG
jgi:hypothetical protein